MRVTLLVSGLLSLSALAFAAAPPQAPPATVAATPKPSGAPSQPIELDADRKPSLQIHGDGFIRGGTLLTVTHGEISNGCILIKGGKIVAVGSNLTPPDGMTVIDATGRFIMPGIIDAHSHLAEDETNEYATSISAEVRIHDVLNPQSKDLFDKLASGITTSLALHGSANAIGGQSVVIKD